MKSLWHNPGNTTGNLAPPENHPPPPAAMPLITRRRAKRREVELRRTGGFPSGWSLLERIHGLESMSRPLCFFDSIRAYSDTELRCRNCGDDFMWSEEAQRLRYEVYQLNPYSIPPYCPDCSRAWHRKKSLRAEYDAKVAFARENHDLDAKRRILALLGELDAAGYELSGRMIYTQEVLTLQLAAAARRAENAEPLHSLTRNHRPLGR